MPSAVTHLSLEASNV